MAGVRSHTDLLAWQLAHELKLRVYALIEAPPLSRQPELCDQLRRPAGNAPRNIAEGFGRYLPNDFIRYLRFANGEFEEILDALRDAHDRRCLDGRTTATGRRRSAAALRSAARKNCRFA